MGIEYDERIFSGAMENREMAVSGARTCFVKADAGEYPVPKEVDRCYFFNPFSPSNRSIQSISSENISCSSVIR